MKQLALVMIGGAMGAGARFALGQIVAARAAPALPVATLLINIIGCLAMGALAAWLARSATNEPLRLLLGVGLLGGFTTFSAFSLDWWQLIERGETVAAITYVALSVVGALGAFALGMAGVRALS
ncbi:MAG: fluoride efflux transporter CrcB [Sphingopyxis sp.]|nr:fluoride efflux transporter CrcB [Sphingopyxis sp.]